MMRIGMSRLLPMVGLAAVLAMPSIAQGPEGTLRYKVVEFTQPMGKTPKWGKLGTDPKQDAGWSPIKVGDQFGAGIVLKVPLRSTVKLVLDPATPPSIVMIEGTSLVSMDDVAMRDASAVTRLGLAYGAIRAGVAEGGVRSDLQIRSPIVTLSKRGTWDFRFFVEAGTGRWQMHLADRGLIEAIQNMSGQRRLIMPGQFVNQLMSRWIQSAQFNRQVLMQDLFGLRGKEESFNIEYSDGRGILLRGGGNLIGQFDIDSSILNNANPNSLFGNLFGGQAGGTVAQNSLSRALTNRLTSGNRGPFSRPDGNFGIGFGNVPFHFPPQGSPSARLNVLKQGNVCAPGASNHRSK